MATVFDDLARAMNDFGMIVVVAVAYGVLYMTALTFGAYLLRGGASVSGGRQPSRQSIPTTKSASRAIESPIATTLNGAENTNMPWAFSQTGPPFS